MVSSSSGLWSGEHSSALFIASLSMSRKGSGFILMEVGCLSRGGGSHPGVEKIITALAPLDSNRLFPLYARVEDIVPGPREKWRGTVRLLLPPLWCLCQGTMTSLGMSAGIGWGVNLWLKMSGAEKRYLCWRPRAFQATSGLAACRSAFLYGDSIEYWWDLGFSNDR
ncbi:hypothetical protein EYF80_036353 [Liparis tanakae]|uniref:Uncharacterized protein n=1 Tax=Liparis tanakae TaxID=230148 RepID=A0A4Z2GKS5_9TELE|nr:hypothetical protein EYF80_036353 [Liparis tanakae]